MKTPVVEVRGYGRRRIDGQGSSRASLSMAATKTMASRQARTVVTSGASGPMPHHLLGLVYSRRWSGLESAWAWC